MWIDQGWIYTATAPTVVPVIQAPPFTIHAPV